MPRSHRRHIAGHHHTPIHIPQCHQPRTGQKTPSPSPILIHHNHRILKCTPALNRDPPKPPAPPPPANTQPHEPPSPPAPANSPHPTAPAASARPSRVEAPAASTTAAVFTASSSAHCACRYRRTTLLQIPRHILRGQSPQPAQLTLAHRLHLRHHRQRNRLRPIAAQVQPHRRKQPLATLRHAHPSSAAASLTSSELRCRAPSSPRYRGPLASTPPESPVLLISYASSTTTASSAPNPQAPPATPAAPPAPPQETAPPSPSAPRPSATTHSIPAEPPYSPAAWHHLPRPAQTAVAAPAASSTNRPVILLPAHHSPRKPASSRPIPHWQTQPSHRAQHHPPQTLPCPRQPRHHLCLFPANDPSIAAINASNSAVPPRSTAGPPPRRTPAQTAPPPYHQTSSSTARITAPSRTIQPALRITSASRHPPLIVPAYSPLPLQQQPRPRPPIARPLRPHQRHQHAAIPALPPQPNDPPPLHHR